jgi:exodeoxyribonuclease VII large subunit
VVVPDRAESLVAIRASGRRLDGAAAGRLRAAAREVVGERRALDRLSPVAQLASARERVGLLLDRGTRAIGGALAGRRSTTERLAGRLGPTLPARLTRERVRLARADALDPVVVRRLAGGRATLGSAAAALAVLGPQATLDRGYAIVRRVDDTRIVRDPADAPPGTRLALRVARGDVPATADDR